MTGLRLVLVPQGTVIERLLTPAAAWLMYVPAADYSYECRRCPFGEQSVVLYQGDDYGAARGALLDDFAKERGSIG